MATVRPTLNFDAPEPAVTTDANASALFPAQPVYARKPSRKSSSNLPLLVGVPVVAVVAGGLIWAMTANRAEAPTDPQSLQTAVADTPAPAPLPANAAATPAPIPQPTEIAANESAPPPVARPAPSRTTASRPAARRIAPVERSAPDVSTASSNVSATVPAAPPTVSAPAIAEPAPLVVPPPAAPQPTPQPEPSNPM